MRKRFYIIASTLLCLSLSCCNNQQQGTKDYKDKDINIIREMEKEKGADKATPVVDKTISLRFYNSTPNIPYISVSDYFKEFFHTSLSTNKKGTYYKYTLSNWGYIAFDSDKDLFSAYNLSVFNSNPDFISSNSKTFLKYEKMETTTPSVKVIPLSNYSIDIHDDGKEAYVPLSFLSKFAGGIALYNAQYNGKDIYVIDMSNSLGQGTKDMKYYADSYYEVIDDLKTERPKDLAKYNYNELCFVFDNLRGYTSQLVFGDNNLLTLGLNGLLERYNPKIKEYLLSTNKKEYYSGVFTLFAGLADGGHTGLLADSSEFIEAAKEAQSIPEFEDLIENYALDTAQGQFTSTAFKKAKKTIFGIEDTTNYYYFDNETKTAYVGFDSFEIDYEGWDKYYNKKGEVPVNTDTYAFIRSTFYKAKEDGVKNYVLDLTSNGGGSSAALQGIVGLLNKAKVDFETNDTFNKYRSTEKNIVDINLDGIYDLRDSEELEQFNFNVGILTSKAAFSCGNLLPSILKGLGYKIIGEKSGGGSCAIQIVSTADGLPFVHSSYICLSDAAGNNIDNGVPVDFQIERIQSDVSPLVFDASNFYNIKMVSEYLYKAYGE